jgi:tripartite ATP-independent transporter DctM subunit
MKIKSLAGVSETLIIFITVIGGMFLGFFTPTEAAAIGAAATLIIGIIRRQMTFKSFIKSLHETVRTSCMVMIIVAGAVMFGHFLAITRLPFDLAEWLAGLNMPGWFIIALIIFFYLIAGCFVDALALVLLTTPIFFPVIMSLKYDPIWFGVMIVVVTQMGVISPPVGINVYVVNGIERDISLQTIFKGALPFLGALIVASAILTAFPQISLFIPNMTR